MSIGDNESGFTPSYHTDENDREREMREFSGYDLGVEGGEVTFHQSSSKVSVTGDSDVFGTEEEDKSGQQESEEKGKPFTRAKKVKTLEGMYQTAHARAFGSLLASFGTENGPTVFLSSADRRQQIATHVQDNLFERTWIEKHEQILNYLFQVEAEDLSVPDSMSKFVDDILKKFPMFIQSGAISGSSVHKNTTESLLLISPGDFPRLNRMFWAWGAIIADRARGLTNGITLMNAAYNDSVTMMVHPDLKIVVESGGAMSHLPQMFRWPPGTQLVGIMEFWEKTVFPTP